MGSGGKTKIEVPKPVVYETRVPEEDFKRGEQVLANTQSRIDDLRETERYTVGNRKYRGYQDAVNRYVEAASYAASIPADQKSYAATYGAGGTGPSSKQVPAQTQTVEQSGFNPANYGEAGIGMKDLTALRNQGFNKDQIAAYVGSQREKGTAIGQRVDASLGLMHQQSTKEGAIKDSGFDPKQYGQAGFGFEDIKELARQGYGKDQISQYVDYLRQNPSKGPAQTKSVAEMGFDPGAYGERGIGQKDLTELRNRGFNREQISQYVDQERAKGTPIGGRVGASLDLMHKETTKEGPVQDYSYKDFGDGMGFGFEDVKELSKRGYGKSQIQNYVRDLEGQGVKIGERVNMSLGYMDPAKTVEYGIGPRVQETLDYMDPPKMKTQQEDGEAPFKVDSTFRQDLQGIVGNAYKDMIGKRRDFEESPLGSMYMRYAGEALS